MEVLVDPSKVSRKCSRLKFGKKDKKGTWENTLDDRRKAYDVFMIFEYPTPFIMPVWFNKYGKVIDIGDRIGDRMENLLKL